MKEQEDQKTVFSFLFFFDCGSATCWTLVPQLGIKPRPPAVEVESPNHWTTREFPKGQSSDEIFAVGMQFTLF